MLKKFISVRNVGRFLNSALPPLPTCTKYTFVYGANGYGKTTLCTILRSLGTNEPALVTGRARLGATAPPQVELLLDSGVSKFENGAWSTPSPDVMVFDGVFIEENVHSGNAVDLEQRRNLYRVIIGRAGVALAVDEERLANLSRTKSSEIKAAEKAVQTHIPHSVKFDDFIKFSNDPEIAAKIITQTKSIEAVREAAQLKVRPGLNAAKLPVFPTSFETILSTTLDDIAEDAQKLIADHLSHHRMGANGESWIAAGVEHISENRCPFCAQPLQGLALIDAYRKVFADAYRGMKESVVAVREAIDRDFGDRPTGALQTLFATNHGALEFWSRYCKLPALTAPAEVLDAMADLRGAAVRLLSQKSAAPQEAIKLDDVFTNARARYQIACSASDTYNAATTSANADIAVKKATLADTDIKKEEAKLATLTAQKKRHDPDVADFCAVHQSLLKEKANLDNQKMEVRRQLEEHTKKVMKPYEARINELLDNFNAGFRIAETNSAYPGGIASSTYQLVINNTGIDLGDAATPLDRPSFKNTLSAGDRSTLALAFFIAHLERDPDRTIRVVVFDDPFTSQDSFRRRQTVHEINKVGVISQQIIVFSHDATFLRQIRDKCPTSDRVALQLADHRSLGIKMVPCDLDVACRGRAASEMDDLQAYITTGAGKDRDVIKKMRIVLESYCRSTYSGCFTSDDRLGAMVEKTKKAGDQHPTWGVVNELEQINEYSRDHHHGEDPQDGSADLIDPQELTGFVRRTLRIVNNLQA